MLSRGQSNDLCILLVALVVGALLLQLYRQQRVKENFSSQHKLKLINFYAPWCGYSQKLLPIWDRLSQRYNDNRNIELQKIDCDKYPEMQNKYQIGYYPTIMVVKSTGETAEFTGNPTEENLRKFIQHQVQGL